MRRTTATSLGIHFLLQEHKQLRISRAKKIAANIRNMSEIMFLAFFVLDIAFAQQTSNRTSQWFASSGMPRRAEATLLLPSTASSDVTATNILNAMLEASGGKARWANVHSATLKVRYGNNAPGGSKERLFMDDWSSQTTRYRRSALGGRTTPKDHEGRKRYAVHTQYGNRVLPEFDQAHLIAGNLPAAAATIILSNPQYIAKIANDKDCSADSVCIDVYLKEGKLYRRQEKWKLSKATHLPETIDLLLHSLFSGGRNPVEEFTFSTYGTREGLLVPTSGSISMPGGPPIETTLVRCDLGRLYDKAKFDAEALQR
jgi:hypothetical protein